MLKSTCDLVRAPALPAKSHQRSRSKESIVTTSGGLSSIDIIACFMSRAESTPALLVNDDRLALRVRDAPARFAEQFPPRYCRVLRLTIQRGACSPIGSRRPDGI